MMWFFVFLELCFLISYILYGHALMLVVSFWFICYYIFMVFVCVSSFSLLFFISIFTLLRHLLYISLGILWMTARSILRFFFDRTFLTRISVFYNCIKNKLYIIWLEVWNFFESLSKSLHFRHYQSQKYRMIYFEWNETLILEEISVFSFITFFYYCEFDKCMQIIDFLCFFSLFFYFSVTTGLSNDIRSPDWRVCI